MKCTKCSKCKSCSFGGRKKCTKCKKCKSCSFGSSLDDKYVNPSGYLSTWYGQPRVIPPSWDPLLLQGQNTFRQGINNPTLSQVVANSYNPNSFGRMRVLNRNVKSSRGWSKKIR